MKNKMVKVKIKRSYNGFRIRHKDQEYLVEIDSEMSVLKLLETIHDHTDRTIAYRNVKCHLGICSACLMKINGRNLRACSVSVAPGDSITIEPVDRYITVRDLVVDFQQRKP